MARCPQRSKETSKRHVKLYHVTGIVSVAIVVLKMLSFLVKDGLAYNLSII